MFSSSLFKELSTCQIIDQGGSWINSMSASFLFSKIVSVKSLFFLIFCKKILRVFKIILYHHPQLSKLSLLWFPRALELSCYANHDWICVFKEKVIAVYLLITFVVNILEWMEIQFFFWSLGRLILKFALQHYSISLQCSNLCSPLHFWHLDLCV